MLAFGGGLLAVVLCAFAVGVPIAEAGDDQGQQADAPSARVSQRTGSRLRGVSLIAVSGQRPFI